MTFPSFLAQLFSCLLVLCVCLFSFVGFGLSAEHAIAGEITGNYREDTLTIVSDLSSLVNADEETPEITELRNQARKEINDYAARYRRDSRVSGLRSFTTMQTALNSLAGFYSSYGSRPLPKKLKQRLNQEFRQVQIALKRGL
jgi:photosystem II Psb27 protein